SRRWRKKRWRTIFSKVPCSGSRKDASGAPRLAPQHLRRHPVVDARARRAEGGTDVLFGRGEPSGLLPAVGGQRAGRGGNGDADGHSGNRVSASAPLRVPAGDSGTAPSRYGGQPQARAADDAKRQLAGGAVPQV